MKECADTYKEIKIFEFPGVIARVHIPDLTSEEKAKRMKSVYQAAAALLKK